MKDTLDQISKNIPQEDKENPTIAFLLAQFEKQFQIILTLKPKIKPSKLPKDPKPKSLSKGSTQKKTATSKINKEERIAPEHIAEGSTFKGLHPYTVRGLQVVGGDTPGQASDHGLHTSMLRQKN